MQSQNHTARNFAWISSDFWSLDAVRNVGFEALSVFVSAALWCAEESPEQRLIPRKVLARFGKRSARAARSLERAGLFVATGDGWTLGIKEHLRFQPEAP
jgi:hypothetical protein